MENAIKFKETYNYDIYKEYNRFYTYRVKKGRRFLIISILYIILVILMQILMRFMPLLTFCAILVGVINIALIISIQVNTKKYYNSSKKFAEKEIEFEFNEEEYKIQTDTSNAILKYEDIYRVAENKKAMYIFISMNQAYIIHQDLIGEEMYNQVRELIKRKVETKKYKFYK